MCGAASFSSVAEANFSMGRFGFTDNLRSLVETFFVTLDGDISVSDEMVVVLLLGVDVTGSSCFDGSGSTFFVATEGLSFFPRPRLTMLVDIRKGPIQTFPNSFSSALDFSW